MRRETKKDLLSGAGVLVAGLGLTFGVGSLLAYAHTETNKVFSAEAKKLEAAGDFVRAADCARAQGMTPPQPCTPEQTESKQRVAAYQSMERTRVLSRLVLKR